MSDEIPLWAIDEALKRCGVDPNQKPLSRWRDGTYARAVELFAAHIAAYEEEPVDPLLIEARSMFAADHRDGQFDVSSASGSCIMKYGAALEEIAAGKHDRHPQIRRYLAALKRGMELAESSK